VLITGYLATEKPMMQRKPGLPSLDGLRYFDAAARNLSFTRAAQDLFLLRVQ
jgi:LysR family glycine cleavage system transcriptional activator